MESREEGTTVMVKLSDGEDVFASLQEGARRHRIDSGAIMWAVGMLQDLEIGFFSPNGYEKKAYPDRHELLAFHGTIAMRAEPKFHIHVALAQRDHGVVGGHLFRAKCCMMNEVCLQRFEGIRMNRKLNPRTTLNEVVFE